MIKSIFNIQSDVQPAESPLKYDIIDSHLHFLDFTQSSDGFPALVKTMDAVKSSCGFRRITA